MWQSVTNGFFLSAGLIVALGAQNAFVLGQSVRREHHLLAAAVCMLCDALLISAGVFGLASLLLQHPTWLLIARYSGALFLLLYALKALQRAWQPGTLSLALQPSKTFSQVLLLTLAVTLLNPHVYVDTVLLIGSIGIQQSHQGAFVLGASAASAVWFSLLALSAARLAPLLARPNTWRVIDGLIGMLMLYLAIQLLWPGH